MRGIIYHRTMRGVHYHRAQKGKRWVAADGAGWIPGVWRFKWQARRGVRAYLRQERS